MSDSAVLERDAEATPETKDMPDVRTKDPVVSIHVSDLHLCHNRPVARADEDWYEVMDRYLENLFNLQEKHKCPLFISGDLFDKWNSPPELINLLLKYKSAYPIYGVPGQHDLPYHSYKDIHKSAFGTLVESEFLRLLSPGVTLKCDNGFCYTGFPWGSEITAPSKCPGPNIAIVHAYIWKDQTNKHKDAPGGLQVNSYAGKLKDYDVAFFGDNHIAWESAKAINCGCFIPRKLDEKKLQPSCWLLHKSLKVTRMYMPTAKDKWADMTDLAVELQNAFDAAMFVKMLKKVTTSGGLDFEQLVREFTEHQELTEIVREEIFNALGLQP